MTRRRLAFGLVLAMQAATLVGTTAPARAYDGTLPRQCGAATLAAPIEGAAAPQPHDDGQFTPVLLVHGWRGNPGMWSEPADRSGVSGPVPKSRSMLGSLQRLKGAAVYTLDYAAVAHRWFLEAGAGGSVFTDAVDCLLRCAYFQGHKMVVVAHSMGGLITRWAVTDKEHGGPARAARIGLVVTLATPYLGSWIAELATKVKDMVGPAAPDTPQGDAALVLLHLLLDACAEQEVDGCRELGVRLDDARAVLELGTSSAALQALQPWPSGIRVETLATRMVLENFGGSFLLGGGVDLDLGDGVVGVPSATFGEFHEVVPECRYTASGGRYVLDRGLALIGFAGGDQPALDPIVSTIFFSHKTTCGHTGQTHLIEMVNEVFRAISIELRQYDAPSYAFLTDDTLGVARGTQVVATAQGLFTEADSVESPYNAFNFTDDGRFVFAVSNRFDTGGVPARVVAIDVETLAKRELRCRCGSAVAAGGSTIAWVDSDGQLNRVDLATNAPPTRASPRLPADAGSRPVGDALIGVKGNLLVSYLPSGVQASRLALLKPDGTASVVIPDAYAMRAAASAITTDGPAEIAVAVQPTVEPCPGMTLALVNADTAATTRLDMSFLPAGANAAQVEDLWWGPDGKLYATISVLSCSDYTLVGKPSLWRRDASGWTNVAGTTAHAVRLMPGGARATVEDAGYDGLGPGQGPLYFDRGGLHTAVAGNVWAIRTSSPTYLPDPNAKC